MDEPNDLGAGQTLFLSAELLLLSGIGIVVYLVVRVVIISVVTTGRKPSTGMAWTLLVLTNLPLGLVAYAFFGRTSVGRGRHRKQLEVNRAIAARTIGYRATLPAAVSEHLATLVTLNRRLGALPMTVGNDVHLLPDYEGSVRAMAAVVARAERFVHVEFYIAAWDEVTAPLLEAMADAAARGVEVRFLFDHLGSRGIPGHRDMLRRLEETGISYRAMLPLKPLRGHWRRPDLRNHRKIVVVDGLVAFTGSQNLTEPSYNKPKLQAAGRRWVELWSRVDGPAVSALDAVFASDWYAETDEVLSVASPEDVAVGSRYPMPEDAGGLAVVRDVACQLVPSGPGFATENNLRLFTSLIYAATRRVSLTSPYFVPDESLLYAVTTAAQRGVEVELFVSEESDQFMVGHAQASYYAALLDAGVRIWLYPAPLVLHAKHFTVDDEVAVIGSSNMDMRSFALNYEASMMMLGPEIASRMREVEDGYRAVCRELTGEEWSGRRRRDRYVDSLMRLTAALQ